MIVQDLHLLTRDEITEQLYQMEVITGKDYPVRFISFIAVNKNYDPSSFSQEMENSEKDTTIDDTLSFISASTLFATPKNKLRNSKKWLENHSKICQASIVPMALLIQSERHLNGRRDFCTEDNINKIMNISEQYGGIVKFM